MYIIFVVVQSCSKCTSEATIEASKRGSTNW